MNDNLFSDFSKVSDSQWMDLIVKDLKGKIPSEKLFTNTLEDIRLNPFYTAETTKEIISLDVKNDWLTTFYVDLTDSTKSDSYLILKDDELVGFDACYVRYNDAAMLQKLLAFLNGKIKKVHLDYTGDEPIPLDKLQIPADFEVLTHGFDVFSQLLESGNMPEHISDKIEQHFSFQQDRKSVRHLLINASIYKNSGAKIYQEVGCILSEVQEYIEKLKEKNLTTAASSITLRVACGTDFFMEIAKLRSVRLLIANLLKAHDLQYNGIHIITEISNEYTSQKDPYTNILRLTTSNISAVMGGCDSLIAIPFMDNDVEFATRIAKNIQLLLKHETHLNKVANPANGSYFIEQLSVEISKKAWNYFKDLEKSGGLSENLKNGKIQKDIKESAEAKLKSYQTNEKILIGVNKYQNPDPITSSFAMSKKERGLIEPLQPINYAHYLESEN